VKLKRKAATFVFYVFLGKEAEKYKMSPTYKGRIRIKKDGNVLGVMKGEKGDALLIVCGRIHDNMKVEFTLSNDISFSLSFERVSSSSLPFESCMVGLYGDDLSNNKAVAVYV
jgi:hypothetical protein